MGIQHDPLDRFHYKKMYEKDTFSRNYPQFDESNELYQTFFQKTIKYTDKTEKVLKGMLEEIQNTPEWQNMRVISVGNQALSFEGTKKLFPKFHNTLQNFRQKAAGKNSIEMDEFVKRNRDGIRFSMRENLKEVMEEMEWMNEALAVMGRGTSEDENVQYDTVKALKLVEQFKNNPTFLKIIKMAGRQQKSAKSTIQTKTIESSNTIVGIQHGNDIERIIPEELAMLLNPKTVPLFAKRYMDNSLQIYKTTKNEKTEFGPIILVGDFSSSMRGKIARSGDLNITKEDFLKGYMFGLLEVAKEKHRPVCVIGFDHAILFSKEIKTTEDILEFMKLSARGNTNFSNPLEEVIKYLESNPKFTKADMIFVSDGDGLLDSEILKKFRETKERISFKTIGVSIGYNSSVMESFCDEIYPIVNCFFGEKELDEFLKRSYSI